MLIKPSGIKTRVWARIYVSGEVGENVTCEIYDDAVSLENPAYMFLFDAATAMGIGFLPPIELYENRSKDSALIIGLRGTTWEEYERYRSTGIKPDGF